MFLSDLKGLPKEEGNICFKKKKNISQSNRMSEWSNTNLVTSYGLGHIFRPTALPFIKKKIQKLILKENILKWIFFLLFPFLSSYNHPQPNRISDVLWNFCYYFLFFSKIYIKSKTFFFWSLNTLVIFFSWRMTWEENIFMFLREIMLYLISCKKMYFLW